MKVKKFINLLIVLIMMLLLQCVSVAHSKSNDNIQFARNISWFHNQLCATTGGLSLKGSTMSKKIPLTQGKFAIVDDEDYEWLSLWKWCAVKRDNTYYAFAYIGGGRKKPTYVYMHRMILKALPGFEIDHINHNGLDNRKSNLRICSQIENKRNVRTFRGRNKFKGVHFYRRTKKWQAYIYANHKRYHLGYFDREVEAAKAYDKKAKELFGEFANTNFV